MKAAQMIGKTFNRLTVIEVADRDARGKARVRCRCECGAEKEFDAYTVSRGTTKSCGCWNSEVVTKRSTTHGMADVREYHVWRNMVQRCTNPNQPAYSRYGAKGISVHPDWVGPGGFEKFIRHIGPSPTEDHEVDRIENKGNYEPGNVRWATRSEQMRNTSVNRMMTWKGETRCLAEWAEITGISRYCIMFRIDRRGWSVDKALGTPSLSNDK